MNHTIYQPILDFQENDEYEVNEQTTRVAKNEVLSIIVFDDERMLEEREC